MRVNPDITSDILYAVGQAQQRQETALAQLSTGKRVNVPSDDPAAAAAEALNVSGQSRNDQYLQSVNTLTAGFQNADSALSSITTALTRAISLGVQGGTGTVSNTDRQQIAQEVQGILDHVVQLANLSAGGMYAFGGTANATAPFAADATTPSGVRYNGNSGVNHVAITDGRTIATNVPGDQLFLHPGADVMGSLQQLVTALQSGTPSAIQNATTAIHDAFSYLGAQRVFYGNALNQLNDEVQTLGQVSTNLRSQENSLVGIDMAKAAAQLASAQTATSAALAAAARVLPVSLLDYLR